MDTNIRVKVNFTQQGTWGGVGFSGELLYKDSDPDGFFSNIGFDFEKYSIALEITEGPEQYIGAIMDAGQTLPGLFASGYDHPLSGKCYLGEMKVGDNAKDMIQYSVPQVVFSMNISYLHIDENTALSEDERKLLLDAVRYDKKAHFSAGASVKGLFTKDEMEGALKGQVFYA